MGIEEKQNNIDKINKERSERQLIKIQKLLKKYDLSNKEDYVFYPGYIYPNNIDILKKEGYTLINCNNLGYEIYQ